MALAAARPALVLSIALGASLAVGAPAQAALVFKTILGPEAAGATGSGTATVIIDEVSNFMQVHFKFQGLSGTTNASHIHGPTPTPLAGTAGVMTATPSFPGFTTGVKSGSYSNSFNLLSDATYRSGFLNANGGTAAGARNALIAALKNKQAYLNIHTTPTYTTGEIRGFFVQETPAPLPMLGAAAGLAWSRRMRRRINLAG